jgi:hypothetical protein
VECRPCPFTADVAEEIDLRRGRPSGRGAAGIGVADCWYEGGRRKIQGIPGGNDALSRRKVSPSGGTDDRLSLFVGGHN